MLYICIFSNKLDLNQAMRVSHTPHKFVDYPTKLIGNYW